MRIYQMRCTYVYFLWVFAKVSDILSCVAQILVSLDLAFVQFVDRTTNDGADCVKHSAKPMIMETFVVNRPVWVIVVLVAAMAINSKLLNQILFQSFGDGKMGFMLNIPIVVVVQTFVNQIDRSWSVFLRDDCHRLLLVAQLGCLSLSSRIHMDINTSCIYFKRKRKGYE